MNSNIMLYSYPDWSERWTIKEDIKQFPNFVFKGVGWYINKTDTILVQETLIENQKMYYFHVWNSVNVLEVMKTVTALPVHT